MFKKRVSNNLDLIVETLEPFRDQLKGLVVESTFNWYWLVDGLMDAGYGCVHLANPSAIRMELCLKWMIFFLRCAGNKVSFECTESAVCLSLSISD